MGQTIGLREMTAAKWHGCAWCKDGIRAGERYQRWLYKDGGDVAFMAMHTVCLEAVERIRGHGHAQYGDEFPCDHDDHERGRGCYDCDPAEGVPDDA